MEFWIKLIKVKNTKNQHARDDLNANCTHVFKNYWLFEGDTCALHKGIKFKLIDEQAIEGFGDLSGKQIKKMVKEYFDINPSTH